MLALAAAGCGSHRTRAGTGTTQAPPQTGRLGTQESLGGVPVPFAHEEFHVVNLYLGHRGPDSVDIYAGYPPSAPHDGQLRVTWIDNRVGTPDPRRSGAFVPPGHHGVIRLTAVHGDMVSFAYKGGTGTFDLATQHFRVGR